MAPISTMSFPDYGLDTKDMKYFKMDSVIQGRGPNRLKYLDLEGRWVLSGKSSIPYISSAFNHLERLNYATVPFRDITDQPLNAIGMMGWTPSSEPVKPPPRKMSIKFVAPPVTVETEVPPSPREKMPHRSAGYGLAHQKRKLSVPDRSRSVSPMRNESPSPTPAITYDKYAKYERNRKDSITRYGTKWGDQGYQSASPSPVPEGDRMPHRTQAILSSPRPKSRSQYDIDYTPSYLREDRPMKDDSRLSTKDAHQSYVPYRSHGYGSAHEKRQYELSPRSLGSAAGDYSSGSEQSSPVPRNADEIVLMAYHAKKSSTLPRERRDYVRH